MPRTRRTMFYGYEMKVMLLPLILCLLQMQAKVRSEELHCRLGTANTTSPMQLDEAISMSQCHIGCVRKYVNVTVALEMATSKYQRWSHLTTSDILEYGSCITLQNVMECRRGCFLRSKSAQMTRTACRKQCVSECRHECGSDDVCSYTGTECSLTCKKSLCGVGCILASEIHTGSGGAPSTPQQPFELTRAESSFKPLPGGIYTVRITEDGMDQEERGKEQDDFSVFIVQVEINGSSFYFPLTSLKDVLNLGHFMCQTVNVSYAVINQSYISDFSPALELSIYGEDAYPAQLPYNGIQYEWIEDTRLGYEKRAVVNITWEPPEGYQYISSYHLVMFSQTDECGGYMKMMTFMGVGNRAYFVWKSMKPYRMPVIHCRYQATITANPCRNPCTTPLQIIIVDTNSMKDNGQPKMNLTCHKYENITTGIMSVHIEWEVENTSRMIETIKNYQVIAKLMDTRVTMSLLLKTLYSQKIFANGSSQVAHVVHGLTPDIDRYHEVVIRVSPAINKDYDWRPLPAYQECRVDIYPSQPSVPSATVTEFFVNATRVFLNLSLIAPASPYGAVDMYEVVLVREPVPDGEDPLSLNLVRRTHLELDNGNQNGILNVENADSAYRHIDDGTLCLFLHIRARNEFVWSDWSDAILLDRYPETSINCTTLQEPQNKINLHTYIAVSLCAVAVAVIAIMSAFIANYLYKRHRIKQQMNKAFQTPGYVNPVFRKYDTKRRSSALWLPVDAPRADDWELPSDNILLTEEEPLGEGCFGTVHRGVVKGPIIHSRMMKNTICINVAIKFLKKTATGSERSDFLTEIETMKQVAEGNNPHIVNMIGCVTLQEPICLVTEFVKYGDLLTYLCTIRNVVTAGEETVEINANDKEPELDAMKEVACADEGVDALSVETQCASYDRLNPYVNLGDLEPVNLISFAYQIASGMEYLSSLGVVHRDLACRNILVGDGKQLKISDFGMARTTVDEVYVKSTKSRLPWKWMAMESIMSRIFTSATDVWAYGVTLWEIATLGGFPYPSTPNGELLEYLRRGNRLECPTNCSQEIYDIMLKCWEDTPDKRPSFTELKTKFAEMLQKNNPYIQLDNINMQKPYYNPQPPEDSTTGSRKQSEERLNDSECAPSISSSSSSSSSDSAPLEASNLQLLSCTNAGEIATMSLEEQQAPLGPPNLYVDTPTTENQFPLQEAAAAEPPALQPQPHSVDAETEV